MVVHHFKVSYQLQVQVFTGWVNGRRAALNTTLFATFLMFVQEGYVGVFNKYCYILLHCLLTFCQPSIEACLCLHWVVVAIIPKVPNRTKQKVIWGCKHKSSCVCSPKRCWCCDIVQNSMTNTMCHRINMNSECDVHWKHGPTLSNKKEPGS